MPRPPLSPTLRPCRHGRPRRASATPETSELTSAARHAVYKEEIRQAFAIISTCTFLMWKYISTVAGKQDEGKELKVEEKKPGEAAATVRKVSTRAYVSAASAAAAAAAAATYNCCSSSSYTAPNSPLTSSPLLRYDLEQVVAKQRALMMSLAFISFIHWKWGNAMPLAFQCISQPMNIWDEPMFQIHVLGRAAVDKLQRPFKAAPNPLAALMGSGADAAAPAAAPAAVESKKAQ